ncbi:hypothetical protein OAN96_00285 [Candidatus Gracilibacteria bacterium]|nr:hypothetical protein [Candidatus Gracilibacteria bacterium]
MNGLNSSKISKSLQIATLSLSILMSGCVQETEENIEKTISMTDSYAPETFALKRIGISQELRILVEKVKQANEKDTSLLIISINDKITEFETLAKTDGEREEVKYVKKGIDRYMDIIIASKKAEKSQPDIEEAQKILVDSVDQIDAIK